MTQRSLFQVQILERLGAPLVAAVGGGLVGDGPQTAQQLAGLLSASVEGAADLLKAMQLEANDPAADSVRLGLIAVNAALIGDYCRRAGQVPDAAAVKRLTGILETILGFADSFVVAGSRLQGMEPGTIPADEDQIALQTVTAFAPIVNTVSFFSFGRKDVALASEIAERLGARAEMLREKLRPGLTNEADGRLAELGLLRGLCTIYIACHEAETRRLQASGNALPTGEIPMNGVWDMFEMRVAMLEVLGGAAMADTGASVAPAAPIRPPVQAAAAPIAPVTPPATPAAQPAAPAAAAAPPPSGAPANPMAFFKPGAKKPAPDAPPADDSGQGAEG